MDIDQDELQAAIDVAEDEWFSIWTTGPEVTLWDSIPVQPGDPAPDFTLPDQTGNPVALTDLTAEGPALMLFWRHFGCGCGVERAARLRDELADWKAQGADIDLDMVRERWRFFERERYLRSIDKLWKHHLKVMESLRQGVYLEAYGQKDPKLVYKKQGYELFEMMLDKVEENVTETLFRGRGSR